MSFRDSLRIIRLFYNSFWQNELENRRAKALEKTQKRISKTKAEANKKLAKARQGTIDKISELSQVSATIRATRNSIWIKLMRLF